MLGHKLQNLLFFDLETTGYKETFEEVQEDNPRLAKLWEKRCVYLQSREGEALTPSELWKTNSGLHAEFGKIVCASFGYYDDIGVPTFQSYYGDDEKENLILIKKLLQKIHTGGMDLCGHNIKGFDIPYLCKRFLANDIIPPVIIQTHNKKPWELTHFDTQEFWSFASFGQKYSSLDLLTCTMRIESPKENMEGNMVHEEYWTNSNVEGIKDYCEQDVFACMKLIKKISEME